VNPPKVKTQRPKIKTITDDFSGNGEVVRDHAGEIEKTDRRIAR
jgi:hypothetical protein